MNSDNIILSNTELDSIQFDSMDTSSWILISSTSSFDLTDYTSTSWSLTDDWLMNNEWNDILKASENNEALQNAIERVKILYYLSKEDGNSKT